MLHIQNAPILYIGSIFALPGRVVTE